MHHNFDLSAQAIWMLSMGFPLASFLLMNDKKDPQRTPGIVTFRRKASIRDRRF